MKIEKLEDAKPCPLCGTVPVRFEDGEYDGDFLYPVLSFRIPGVPSVTEHSKRLVHAVCHESAGGCGHVAVGFSYAGAIQSWNSYHEDPSLQVRYDLPIMEASIKEHDERIQKWYASLDPETGAESVTSSGFWEELIEKDWACNQETIRAIRAMRGNPTL